MARRSVITAEIAERILGSFRTHPDNAAAAARVADCDPRTAKKAWQFGLLRCPDVRYHKPFEELLAIEQEETRARLQCEQDEASRQAVETEASRRAGVKEKALSDVTEQRTHEEQLVRGARTATIVLLNNVTNIAAGATALGRKVRATLEAHAMSAANLTIREAKDITSLVGRLATSLRQLNDAGQKAMEMSRLLVGEPTSIVGIQHLDSISMVEAVDRVEAAQRAIAELNAEGVGIIDGNVRAVDAEFN